MKLENKQKIDLICTRVERLKKAKISLEKWLNRCDGDSNGTEYIGQRLLYGFHISEYRDSSGANTIDSSGCLIGYSILTELESKIDAQINKDLAELETL